MTQNYLRKFEYFHKFVYEGNCQEDLETNPKPKAPKGGKVITLNEIIPPLFSSLGNANLTSSKFNLVYVVIASLRVILRTITVWNRGFRVQWRNLTMRRQSKRWGFFRWKIGQLWDHGRKIIQCRSSEKWTKIRENNINIRDFNYILFSQNFKLSSIPIAVEMILPNVFHHFIVAFIVKLIYQSCISQIVRI